mmetsp:Transcript_63476/g.178652  ORF Transcript_63476/g.178652 Transcript_63476/m.178652 type:complete len:184 (-) Transcript_63476:63-614(-)
MAGVRKVVGALLEFEAQYIVHQVSCIHTEPASGLASAVFAKHPAADVYADRRERRGKGETVANTISPPGTISVHDGRIVNLYGQYIADKPVADPPGEIPALAGDTAAAFACNPEVQDTREQRLGWFKAGLREIPKVLPEATSIAIPQNVGCGIAGGVWAEYEAAIADFAAENPGLEVSIVARS